MKTESLDLLEKSQLPPAQARAILRVMESELAAGASALATRADLLSTTSALKSDLLSLETNVKDELHKVDLRVEKVRTEMQSLRADLLKELKGSTRWNFAFWATQFLTIAALLIFKR